MKELMDEDFTLALGLTMEELLTIDMDVQPLEERRM